MKSLHTEIGKGQQDVVYTELLDHDSHKLKVVIRRDSYEFQSTATIQVFDTSARCWNPLAELHYSKMLTPTKLHVMPGESDKRVFASDRDFLLHQAKLILGAGGAEQ